MLRKSLNNSGKIILSVMTSIVVALFMTLSISVVAYAGNASGQTVSWPAGGKTYRAYNNIVTVPGAYAHGRTYVGSTSSVSAGYLGASSKLYKNDTLYASSPVYYNTSTYSAGSYYYVTTVGQGNSSVSGRYYYSYGSAYSYDAVIGN